MKQVIQYLKSGGIKLLETPRPRLQYDRLLIQTTRTLISSGTERMLVEFGQANMLQKAWQQPEKVKMVLDKVKTDGLLPTIAAVRAKLDQPMPMGYCNVGRIIDVSGDVGEFNIGDRVVSNGHHAELVVVPKHLAAKIPDEVSDDQAVFTVLTSIALQGIRLASPVLGETVAVIGLGLIGLLTVQLLRAQGCNVLGIDLDPNKVALAKRINPEIVAITTESVSDPMTAALALTQGQGVDAVLITAATKSNDPIRQAAALSRKRGRIVLVGVTGLELSRADFYEKELSFQVSCSYGPGRYDTNYEDKGIDYPYAYVRWTEQRHFMAVLELLKNGNLVINPLISHRFDFNNAIKAYELLRTGSKSLGIILNYPEQSQDQLTQPTIHLENKNLTKQSAITIGCFGAGNYAKRILIPAFKRVGVELKTLVTSGGISAIDVSKRFGFKKASTDAQEIMNDDNINTVIIATRHNTHADYVCEALKQGKMVFVEKPLCISLDELEKITSTIESSNNTNLMIGFNRRFSPFVQKIKQLLLKTTAAKTFIVTINAGFIPLDHWTQDISIGGGRIIGEACHFIDLLRFLTAVPIVSFQVSALDDDQRDNTTITLKFTDGSIGTIHYFANGHRTFPKEKMEIFCQGRILQLDNFRQLNVFGWPGFKKMKSWQQDKGQQQCVKAFIEAAKSGDGMPISLAEILDVSRVTIEIANQLKV